MIWHRPVSMSNGVIFIQIFHWEYSLGKRFFWVWVHRTPHNYTNLRHDQGRDSYSLCLFGLNSMVDHVDNRFNQCTWVLYCLFDNKITPYSILHIIQCWKPHFCQWASVTNKTWIDQDYFNVINRRLWVWDWMDKMSMNVA